MPVEWLTTSTILRDLCETSDGRAWRLLVERFRGPIVHFARQAGLSPVEAEDAAQETLAAFVQAYRDGRYQRERGRLGQWLFGIAWRLVQRQRRLVARQPALLSGERAERFWADLPDDHSAVAEWDQQWERSLLEACLARVREEVDPETYRAFEAAMQCDEPAAVIAERLGVPVKTVYNAKHRVLRRLRELKDELEQTDADFAVNSRRGGE